MSDSTVARNTPSAMIDRLETTPDTLTGRGGLALFSRYLRGIELAGPLERLFGAIRQSSKGQPVTALFHQLLCFFLDGTSTHLVRFDRLADDAGYAAAIETEPAAMASSHMIKRFFSAFSWGQIWLFRPLLRRLFLWRLAITRPEVVVLNIDTMVMDNDTAEKRHGVSPTYKRVKGFQPLQITWQRFVVDAVFRGGTTHGNRGETAGRALERLVKQIRAHYREAVPIVVRCDSGFFDQKLLARFEALEIGYIVAGKLYEDLRNYARRAHASTWKRYDNGTQQWSYLEFGDRRGSWSRGRRALYCRPAYEEEQRLLRFARPDTVLYTNLGQGEPIDAALAATGHSDWTRPERILERYHGRGRDELVHRAIKDFAAETLPFHRFAPNVAYYYTMLLAFVLYEAFKQDVTAPIVPVASYPTRLRRNLIDIAAKIVKTAHRTILKVSQAAFDHLDLPTLWKRSADPPRFAWT